MVFDSARRQLWNWHGLASVLDPGDEILLFPLFITLFNTIKNNGRVAKEIPLKIVEGQYEVDFNELDKNLSVKKKLLFFVAHIILEEKSGVRNAIHFSGVL